MRTLVAEILAAWRRAERLAGELEEGTAEHDAAVLACERLRDLYRTLTSTGLVADMTEADARALLAELARSDGPVSSSTTGPPDDRADPAEA